MGRKRTYDVNDYFFDVIDTQEKAYIFGLLYADGCNYEDTGVIKIDLMIDDYDLLKRISDIIEFSGTLKIYDKEKIKIFNEKEYECKPSTRLQFRSKHMSAQLAKKGCVKHKSSVAMFPNNQDVPNHLLKHFIRGYMDGNGGIAYWIDNLNTGHKKFSIHFCGTIDIINNLVNILGNEFNCKPAVSDRHPDRDNNNLQMNICGNQIVKRILDWLYVDATIYMQRKYEKYLILLNEINRVENDTNLYGNAYKRRPVINLETKEIYSTVNGAGKVFGVKGSTIYSWCHKRNKVMYLDEYEALQTEQNKTA